jgi:hypothetical protein
MYDALGSAVKVLLPTGIITGFPDSWERALAKWIGKNAIKQYVKKQKPLSSIDRFQEIDTTRKKKEEWSQKTKNTCTTIVSGHTHVVDDQPTTLNLGSWLVEPNRPDPDSFVLLIDDDKRRLIKV